MISNPISKNEIMNQQIDPDDSNNCKICMDAIVSCAFVPCGHIATCFDCGSSLKDCPICREKVNMVLKTFKAWNAQIHTYDTRNNCKVSAWHIA
jgi:hypothetical protein